MAASSNISRVAEDVGFCVMCSAPDRARFIAGLRVERDRVRCADTESDIPAGQTVSLRHKLKGTVTLDARAAHRYWGRYS